MTRAPGDALGLAEATCVWCIAGALTVGLPTVAATARYLIAPGVTTAM